jgi:hypothetical protein
MVCVGMGSALPLSFRKVFHPEKQDKGELVCPLIRPQLKIRKLTPSSPSLTTAYPPSTPPKELRPFFPCVKNVQPAMTSPKASQAFPLPALMRFHASACEEPNIALWSFLHNMHQSPLHKKLHFRHTPKKAFVIRDFDTTPPRMTLLSSLLGIFWSQGAALDRKSTPFAPKGATFLCVYSYITPHWACRFWFAAHLRLHPVRRSGVFIEPSLGEPHPYLFCGSTLGTFPILNPKKEPTLPKCSFDSTLPEKNEKRYAYA